MLVIRLQRRGKKKQAFFRVVLQEKAWQPKGKAIEILGFYNPHTKEKNFQAERINYWVSKGAQMTPTLHNLLVDGKVIDGPKKKAFKVKPKKKESEKPAEAQAQAQATTPSSPDTGEPEKSEVELSEEIKGEDKKEEEKEEKSSEGLKKVEEAEKAEPAEVK